MKMQRKIFPHRVVLYPADVSRITGQTERSARSLLRRIRIALGKTDGEFVTSREFSSFCGIDEELVNQFLKDS